MVIVTRMAFEPRYGMQEWASSQEVGSQTREVTGVGESGGKVVTSITGESCRCWR